jgi:hypothetical protein
VRARLITGVRALYKTQLLETMPPSWLRWYGLTDGDRGAGCKWATREKSRYMTVGVLQHVAWSLMVMDSMSGGMDPGERFTE